MTFYEVITAAIADMAKHGFDSQYRVDNWMRLIREAAVSSLVPQHVLDTSLKNAMTQVYNRQIEKGGALKMHKGISRYTIDKLKPQLRAELSRRIMASANLIKLNREQSIQRTLQRFSGWATSIPDGGSLVISRREESAHIRKSLSSLPFEERRVIIDQGHKLTASLNEIIANEGGAIAGEWHSHWKQAGYNYRKDHKERDQHVYLIRGNWASEKGLVKPNESGYTDEITRVGEEPFCRCFMSYIYNLNRLPDDMLTNKGRDAIKRAI